MQRVLAWVVGLALTIAVATAHANGARRTTHTVVAGDTLHALARRYGCTVRELEDNNQLGATLPIGKRLVIPGCGKAGGAAAARLEPHPRRAAPRAPAKRDVPRSGDRSDDADRRERSDDADRRERSDDANRRERTDDANRRERTARSDRADRADRAAPTATGTAAALGRRRGAAPAEPPLDVVVLAPPQRTVDASPDEQFLISSPTQLASEPAARHRGPAAPSGQPLPADEAALDDAGQPQVAVPELDTDGPSDHKLVLDGRGAATRLLADPEPRAGQSFGLPWRGRLRSPDRLSYGDGYVLRRPARTYGTTTTVAHVERALAELRQKFPRLHPLAVGDLSAADGGPISEHRSHQSGRDIDLGLCFLQRPPGYPESFVVATEETLDAGATWALISALVDTRELDGGLTMIFLDYEVQGMIYRWALAAGVDRDRLDRVFQYPHGRGAGAGIVRHAPNHSDHLHARFGCAAAEPRCRS